MFQPILELRNLRNKEARTSNSNKESTLSCERILSKIRVPQETNPAVNHRDHDFVFRIPRVRENAKLEKYSLNNLISWIMVSNGRKPSHHSKMMTPSPH